MLSGIGPVEHLRQVGIESHVNLPGVGENLQDHLEVSMMCVFIVRRCSAAVYDKPLILDF